MRFTRFSADPFLQPGSQFYSGGPCGVRGQRCPGGTSGCSRASFPTSSWPNAATFIPVVMMGGQAADPCQHRGNPCQHRGDPSQHRGDRCQHTGDPSQHAAGDRSQHRGDPSQNRRPDAAGLSHHHQFPDLCPSDCLQPVISDAVSLTQGLLKELLGQPGAEQRYNQTTGKQATEKKGRQTADKKSSSQRSCPGSCCGENSSASRCCQTPQRSAKPSAQRPSNGDEKKTDQKASAEKATLQQRSDEQCATKEAEQSSTGDVVSPWSHSLYFPRFSPNKVSAKVRNGKVHVHVRQEKKDFGPGACTTKLEATRIIQLPENVDQRTLTCTMKLDGTLQLQARWKESPALKAPLENKAERVDALENTAGEDQDSDDKPEHVKTEAETEVSMEKAINEEERQVAGSESHTEEKADDEEERQADSVSQDTTVKEAELCEDEPEKDQTTEQQLIQCAGGEKAAKQDTHCEEHEHENGHLTLHHQADLEDGDASNQTAPTAEENPTITFAIVQEPEDDDSSVCSEEESPLHNGRRPSTEDFVIIDDDSNNTGNVTPADGDVDAVSEKSYVDQASEELMSLNPTLTEEKEQEQEAAARGGEEHTVGSAPDETDPTRPIKRSDHHKETSQQVPGEQNPTVPQKTPGTVGDGSERSAPLTSPQHPHDTFRASLPLAGFSPENVHVSLEDRTLHVAATRQAWVTDGDVPYTESVRKQLELPGHVDVLTLRCVYQENDGRLIVTAASHTPSQQRDVPVVLQ